MIRNFSKQLLNKHYKINLFSSKVNSISKEEFEIKSLQLENQILEFKNFIEKGKQDLQNIENRTKKDLIDCESYAIQSIVKDILTTVDNLTLAIKWAPKEEENKIKLFYNQVLNIQSTILNCLKDHGVQDINPINQKFDPNLHQALYMAPVPGKDDGLVLSVEKIGYKLNDRVIRPAQVGVVTNNP